MAARGSFSSALRQLGGRLRLHLEPRHELRRDHVGAGGIRRHAKGPGQGGPRRVRLAGVDVRQAEDVTELEVVGRPLPRLLEQRDRLRVAAVEVVGEAEDLHRLAALDRTGVQAVHDAGELDNRPGDVIGVIVGNAEQPADLGRLAGDRLQLRDRVLRPALGDQLARLGPRPP